MPAFERIAPPPPPDSVLAHLEAGSAPGDIVLDLHARGGWIARAAVDRQRRAVTLETNPLTRLLAEVVLRPPDLRHLDAAFSTLSASPRGDTSLKLAIGGPFATRCATCDRSLIADEFSWAVRDDPALPGALALERKSYRCAICRDMRGGLEQRQAAIDDADHERAGTDVGAEPIRRVLRERFPVPDTAAGLPDAILDLHTDRQLVGLAAILERIEGDLRAAPVESALRLAFLHAVLPASRLGTGPGRIPGIRIAGGAIRSPMPDPVRERNPWVAFEEGFRTVRSFVQQIESSSIGPLEARLGTDLRSLVDGSATAIVRLGSDDALEALTRSEDALRERGPVRPTRIRLILGQPPFRFNQERLAATYHGTCWALGREAAALLPLEPLGGAAIRAPWSWQSEALRRSLEGAGPHMTRDGRAVMVVDGHGPEGLAAAVIGGVGAGYRLSAVRFGDADSGTAGFVEFVPPGATVPPGSRTRAGQSIDPMPGGSGDPAFVPGRGLFSAPEPVLARPFSPSEAQRTISEVAVTLLRDRGEPIRFERLLGEILIGLDRAGHLARLFGAGRSAVAAEPGEPDIEPVDQLIGFIRDELTRPNHPRLREIAPDQWWLESRADRDAAALPLSDRVEWAVYSLLSTAGPLDEVAFLERIDSLFRGPDLPEEGLVRACLASYRSPSATDDRLVTGDDLRRRTADHTEILARLADAGHRLGMHVWIGQREQARRFGSGSLGDLLTSHEQTAWLPAITRASADDLADVDCIWYVRGRTALLFEVEWTAMMGETILRRHSRIPADDRLVRFLVAAPERAELIRYKLDASPVLRSAMAADNWHVILWPHLRSWLEREPVVLADLEPFLGLDPAVSGTGRQMDLFPASDAEP
ncbi:MAG: hypothetical protein EPO00_09855 [Chloroflexota bacterium]|nr:MAG: hypothetical protein EPO00_09855 [Chloroflexota bacterium]